jgi:16S rRNA (cytosine1402-N4)-methyltransferase
LARPLQTTAQLADLIVQATADGAGEFTRHTYLQALRIAVNQELQSIEEFLPQAVQALAPGGRLAVISFHSLEDRIVKQFFRRESRDCICPPEQPVCICGHKASLLEVTRHPIEASPEESSNNPRARSAKLRIVEKLTLA